MIDYAKIKLTYCGLTGMDQFRAAADLEIAIWNLNPRDAVPANLIRAVSHIGGAMHGAYDGEKLVGIAFSLPARVDNKVILWSHMTGVHPAYQGHGIGFGLKCIQREWALERGYHVIRWTFDPLQRGNANFNLHRLGAITDVYHENFYGVMHDGINRADIPSDRLEVCWNLTTTPLEPPPDGESPRETAAHYPYLLYDDNGLPALTELDETEAVYLVQIPANLTTLPHPQALLQWRLALRTALSTAFSAGYTATDFTAENAYLLRRS